MNMPKKILEFPDMEIYDQTEWWDFLHKPKKKAKKKIVISKVRRNGSSPKRL